MEQKDIIYIFEREFRRILTPMEEEFIQDWKKLGYTEEEIIKGLKESVFNGVQNFRYINKILRSWRPSETKQESTPDSPEPDLSWLE